MVKKKRKQTRPHRVDESVERSRESFLEQSCDLHYLQHKVEMPIMKAVHLKKMTVVQTIAYPLVASVDVFVDQHTLAATVMLFQRKLEYD